MKRHLLVFLLATLLAAGLNERNNTLPVASADFPASAPAMLSQKDDSGSVEIAREANSLFTPPAVRNASAGDHSQHNFRIRHTETTTFTSAAAVRNFPAPVAAASYIIAAGGAFHRPSDYYVYTLRHIVI